MIKLASRRDVLKGLWVAPTVVSISLPVHAQTSPCSIQQLEGSWAILIAPASSLGANGQITLNSDGTTSNSSETWSIDGVNGFLLENSQDPSSIESFIGDVDSSCTEITGTVTNWRGSTSPGETVSFVLNKL